MSVDCLAQLCGLILGDRFGTPSPPKMPPGGGIGGKNGSESSGQWYPILQPIPLCGTNGSRIGRWLTIPTAFEWTARSDLLCTSLHRRFSFSALGRRWKVQGNARRATLSSVDGRPRFLRRGISKCSDKDDECHINVSPAKMPLGQMLRHDNGGGIPQPTNYFLIVPSPQNL